MNQTTAATPVFENLTVGDEITPLVRGPITTSHLMRWSAAIENWHRIHYDRRFAQEQDKLPDLLVNGSLKQQFITQIVKDWAGRDGWVWKVGFQFRAMNTVGDTLHVWGKVKSTERLQDYGLVVVELGIVNQDGKENTPGQATVALPFRGGQPVPYPFVPPPGTQAAA